MNTEREQMIKLIQATEGISESRRAEVLADMLCANGWTRQQTIGEACLRNMAEISGWLNENISSIQKGFEEQTKLEYISGHTIEELLKFFAAGYTLKPPEPPKYDEMKKLANQGFYKSLSKSVSDNLSRHCKKGRIKK